MWFRDYQDTKNDSYLNKHRVERSNKPGCEMRERAGWGEEHEEYNALQRRRKPGLLGALLGGLFGGKLQKD